MSRATEPGRIIRIRLKPGQAVVLDRGHARMRDFRTVLAAGADFITRIGWNALRLHAAAGQRIDVLALLPQADATADCLVYVKDMPTPLRLVIQRMRPEQARRGRPNGIVRTRRGRPASRAGRLIHVP